MNSITHRLNEVIEDKVPKLEWIASINYNVLDIARGLRNALLEAQDPAQMEAQIANVLEARKDQGNRREAGTAPPAARGQGRHEAHPRSP
jgi:hypothetical protein